MDEFILSRDSSLNEEFDISEESKAYNESKILNITEKIPVNKILEDFKSDNEKEKPPRKKPRSAKKENSKIVTSSGEVVLESARKFPESQQWSTAVRLHEDNVSPEVVEGILFDTLDGEIIIAEYQQLGYLSETSQQNLTNLLINRSTKSLLTFNKINDYFDRLSNAIITLFPDEPKAKYYIAPKSEGNTSKNSKGKLPDKWRNTRYLLRKRGLLPNKTTTTSELTHDLSKNMLLTDYDDSRQYYPHCIIKEEVMLPSDTERFADGSESKSLDNEKNS